MLYRNQQQGYISGVSKGIADTYNIPVSLVRLLFIATTFLFGIGTVAYLILTSILPDGDISQANLNF